MIARVIGWLFPSVPPRDQAIVLAAMEGRTIQTPGAGVCGEAHPAPGQPEGGDGLPSVSPSPLSSAPEIERRVSQSFHPSMYPVLSDHHLAHLLDQWGATS